MDDTAQLLDGELADALDAMDQGLLWVDEQLVVKRHNRAYRALWGIEEADRFVGRPCRELLEFLVVRRAFVGIADTGDFVADCLSAMRNRESHRLERLQPDGKVLSVSSVPLASGGYVYACLDITREIRAEKELQRSAKATVVAMANFAEHRDTDTGVHVLRVSRLVGQTARQLRRRGQFSAIIDDAYIEHVATASVLHDVGKISTPDRILAKTGPLSEEEREIINLHAATGAQLLKQARLVMGDGTYLQMGAEIALTHHERFDGGGYPSGLAGEDIPLSGRICAIADVFDALTSRRPYKAPWSTEQAITHIAKQRGTQFDPVVVDAFIEMIERRATVSLVQWLDSMSVGNLHIDEQHQILIETINQLASAESQNDRSVVSMIIDELVAYAAFHFEFEERLIEAAGYPHLEKHRRIHQGFVKWISDVREEFLQYHRAHFGERILKFLCDWLLNHILGEDQRYRTYIGG